MCAEHLAEDNARRMLHARAPACVQVSQYDLSSACLQLESMHAGSVDRLVHMSSGWTAALRHHLYWDSRTGYMSSSTLTHRGWVRVYKV